MDENKLLESIGDLIDKKLDQMRDDMNKKFEEVNQEMRKYNQRLTVFENVYGAKVDASLAGIANIQERFKRQDRLEEKVDNHDVRIFALEHAIKK